MENNPENEQWQNESTQTTTVIPPAETAPITPAVVPPAPQVIPATAPQAKSHRKLLVAAILLLVVGAATYFLYVQKSSPVKNDSARAKGVKLVSSEPQAARSNRHGVLMAVGAVRYDQTKLAPVATQPPLSTALKEIAPEATTGNRVYAAFYEHDDSPTNTSLVMYDFKTNTTRTIVAESGEQRYYSNPIILSDHYVAFYTGDYTTPVDIIGSIRVVDLLTGEQTTLVKDKADNLPSTFCCSVSPNGLYLAIPQLPHKISLYAAGGGVKQLSTTASFIPGDASSNTSDYAAAQLASGYAPLRWLDDGTLILANKPAMNYNKNAFPEYSNNGLMQLDIATNTSRPLARTNDYPITWFDVANGTIVFTSATPIIDPSGATTIDSTKPFEAVDENAWSYKIDGYNAPAKLGLVQLSIPFAKLFDPATSRFYVGGNANPITIFNIKDKTTTVVTGADVRPQVGSLLDSDTMIYLDTGTTSTSEHSLNLYNFSTHKTSRLTTFR